MPSPWYPFFPGDYARDTSHLALAEHGAYRLLLDHYYSTGRPIPADLERAFRICRAFNPELQDAVHSVLKQFFTETPDGWRNQRADRQIEKQQRISAKYAARAKNAAAARWEHENASSIRQAMLEASEPEPEPEKSKPESEILETCAFTLLENARAREVPNDAYPIDDDVRRVAAEHPALEHLKGKMLPQDEEQAIGEAIVRDGVEAVLAGTRNLKYAVCQWPPGEHRFIPNPVRFYRRREYLKNPRVWERRSKSDAATEEYADRYERELAILQRGKDIASA